MSYSRRSSTAPDSRKRKEREMFYPNKPLVPLTSVTRAVSGPPKPNLTATTSFRIPDPTHPVHSNRLLAGYMAYEFLTGGTLLGHKVDSTRSEPELKKKKPVSSEAEPNSKPASYAEVANILKSDGAHVPGVVNPTQLARWIKM